MSLYWKYRLPLELREDVESFLGGQFFEILDPLEYAFSAPPHLLNSLRFEGWILL